VALGHSPCENTTAATSSLVPRRHPPTPRHGMIRGE
jgi:hypothetical protein